MASEPADGRLERHRQHHGDDEPQHDLAHLQEEPDPATNAATTDSTTAVRLASSPRGIAAKPLEPAQGRRTGQRARRLRRRARRLCAIGAAGSAS